MSRVCIAGVTGWVGQPLAAAIEAAEDLELVAAVERQARGTPLGRLIIRGSVEEALAVPSDVFVDYTSAVAVKPHVLAVRNFAITAALLQRFAVEAARHLSSWEIIDTAHAGKMDAPSGTARELAWRLSEVRAPELEVPVEKTAGMPPRGAAVNQSRIHSVRLPGYTIGVEVRFGQQDERLTLSYDGGPGATPYVAGTLLAIRRVHEFVGVVRGMDRLL